MRKDVRKVNHQIAQQKLEQAIGYLNEQNVDMWLIYASEGSDPAVNLLFGIKTVGRIFFILTKDGKKLSIASVIDAQESEESGLFDEVIKYQGDPAETVLRVIKALNPSKIALNYSQDDNLCDGLTAGRYRYLKRILGEELSSRFISSQPILERVRSIKTSHEIAAITRSIELTQDIFAEVFSQLHVGMSEYEVGLLFIEGMSKRGVVEASSKELEMPIIMKERIAHRAPGPAVIEPGDFLIMDFGIDCDGYCSDISRTVYFLKPGETDAPESFKKKFEAAHGAITRAFETAKPGVIGWMVDQAAREYLLSCGMPEITHATGHQLGQYEHDGGAMFGPRWERYGKAPYGVIEENMVLTLEPTILYDNDYSVLCEEDIVITKDGARFLSKRQDSLILIG